MAATSTAPDATVARLLWHHARRGPRVGAPDAGGRTAAIAAMLDFVAPRLVAERRRERKCIRSEVVPGAGHACDGTAEELKSAAADDFAGPNRAAREYDDCTEPAPSCFRGASQ